MSSGPTRQHPPTRRAPAITQADDVVGVEGGLPLPLARHGVPRLPGVGVDDAGAERRSCRGYGVARVERRRAVDADGDDLGHVGGHRERLREVLALARAAVHRGQRQPRRHAGAVELGQHRLDLRQARDGLEGEHVGATVGRRSRPARRVAGGGTRGDRRRRGRSRRGTPSRRPAPRRTVPPTPPPTRRGRPRRVRRPPATRCAAAAARPRRGRRPRSRSPRRRPGTTRWWPPRRRPRRTRGARARWPSGSSRSRRADQRSDDRSWPCRSRRVARPPSRTTGRDRDGVV